MGGCSFKGTRTRLFPTFPQACRGRSSACAAGRLRRSCPEETFSGFPAVRLRVRCFGAALSKERAPIRKGAPDRAACCFLPACLKGTFVAPAGELPSTESFPRGCGAVCLHRLLFLPAHSKRNRRPDGFRPCGAFALTRSGVPADGSNRVAASNTHTRFSQRRALGERSGQGRKFPRSVPSVPGRPLQRAVPQTFSPPDIRAKEKGEGTSPSPFGPINTRR